MFRFDKIHVLDKKQCNHDYYNLTGVGLNIDSITIGKEGYVKGWQLATIREEISGDTIDELVEKLKCIKEQLNLEKHSDYNKDILCVYVNNLDKAYGFLHNYDQNIEKFGDYYFDIFDCIEIRDITHFFTDNVDTAEDIAFRAQHLIDDVFEKDKYFYITPTQMVIRRIRKNCNDDLAEKIFPESPITYNDLMSAYFGGFCICSYPGLIVDDFKTVEYDRTSAYIYDLLIEKHVCEPMHSADPEHFQYYIDNSDKYFALCELEIKCGGLKRGADLFKQFSTTRKKIEPYKSNIIMVTNTDYEVLRSLVEVLDVKCRYIQVAKKDYLPRYVAEIIEQQYIEKVKNPTVLNKIKVNSIYGATVKKITDFKEAKNSATLAPQWGVLTTSYARKNLLTLASKLRNWLYTDTDSIICEFCEENEQLVELYNHQIQNRVYEYCTKFGLDYQLFKDLGTFKRKKIMKKFKANGKKQYMYTLEDGTFVFKGSGINGINDESAYEGNIDTGYKVRRHISDKKVSRVIDGVEYTSNGFYWESKGKLDDLTELAAMYAEIESTRRKKV